MTFLTCLRKLFAVILFVSMYADLCGVVCCVMCAVCLLSRSWIVGCVDSVCVGGGGGGVVGMGMCSVRSGRRGSSL